jgi:DNA polymerase III alpha subunit
MRTDNYGQIILSEKELCNLYLQNPNRVVSKTLIDHSININDDLELTNIPQLIQYVTSTETIEEFDKRLQSNWYMPDEYKNLDIAKWILDQCQTDSERQRVGEELLLYLDRNLFQLLQYLKYLVDTMRKHNIVWGVGRGSSVASYVLYLIGVHKINSMYYDLDIEEFLR